MSGPERIPRAGAGRRDRRGRGLRGPLAPAALPLSLTRAEVFADLVLDAVERLQPRLPDLDRVEVLVEEVPAADLLHGADTVPLGRAVPAMAGNRARVVVHRRAVELRSPTEELREDLVRDVVAEQVGSLFGLTPEQVDPDYGRRD